jgi:hypothetical protein
MDKTIIELKRLWNKLIYKLIFRNYKG